MMIKNCVNRVPGGSRMSVTAFKMVSLIGLLSTTSLTAFAQIQSAWTSGDSSYESYTTVYQCRAATVRIGQRILGFQDYDTMSMQAIAAQTHMPKEAKEAAEQCLRQIVIDSLKRDELLPMAGLYMAAGRDKEAAAMIERIFAGQWNPAATDTGSMLSANYFTGPDSNTRKAAIHNLAAMAYLNSTPVRFSAALSHLDAFEQLAPDERMAPLMRYNDVFRKARDAGDSAAMKRASQRLADLGPKLTTTERQNAKGILLGFERHRTAQLRFDSLRLNTEAYVTFQKSQLFALDISDRMLGSTMDTLAGEFRFPAAPVYPVPGKVSLVMVLGRSPVSPYVIFPMLHRLKQKHPDLEVVYVSQTGGQLGTGLLSPEEQAETERRWVQDVSKMPFSVLIEKAAPWRLQEPDRRLVFGATPNEQYKNRLWLVDRSGTIVFHSPISKEPEAELDQLITALHQQQ